MPLLPVHDLQASRRAAARYLRDQQSPDHLWRDFRTLAGESTDWVSAFVLHAAGGEETLRGEAFRAAKALMFRQRPDGGWAYGDGVPSDCDSTAWVLFALGHLPMWRPSALWRARAYLRRHQVKASGGFTTYAPEDGIDRYIGAPDPGSTAGWLTPHTCVTAVAAGALAAQGERGPGLPAALAFLEARRGDDGTWTSYWWNGLGYATYHAARTLLVAGRLSHGQLGGTHAALLARQRPDGGWSDGPAPGGGAFATAHAVLTLLLDPTRTTGAAAARGVQWLLGHQRRDGSWRALPILRIPPPMVRDPGQLAAWRVDALGTGVLLADQHRLFTTAAALRAVTRFEACTFALSSLPRGTADLGHHRKGGSPHAGVR